MIRTRRAPTRKMITDINITPFTDVCLVLLIIFMVTATSLTKESSLKLKLPQASPTEAPLPSNITVRITRDQQIYVNADLVSLSTLSNAIKTRHEKYGADLLVVKADEGVPYRLVVTTIDMARQVGVNQFALATRQPEGVSPPIQP
ncbi:MAG: ExbD/TolR family protein [Armatimonadota bacterium]